MFGKRKVPFGSKPPEPPSSGGSVEPFPVDRMDRALEAAIILLTHALDEAGVDAGSLAIRQPRPANVGALLAGCTTYQADAEGPPTFLALGLTRDFKQFSYPPHCRLYFILNAVGIAEDSAMRGHLPDVARAQFKGPLVDAALMRVWVRHILKTNDALRGGGDALHAFAMELTEALAGVAREVPRAWGLPLDDHVRDFADGFPGTIGHKLLTDTPRFNGLPVTPFISDVLTRYLADLQMRGLSAR